MPARCLCNYDPSLPLAFAMARVFAVTIASIFQEDSRKLSGIAIVSRTGTIPMSYLLLIVEPVGQRAQRTPEEGREAYAQMVRYAEGLKARGLLTQAESLKSESEGVRLQIRDGERSLMDGPYAEAKEMIGGFFLLTCDTREEALALAAECPAAQWATVEVRELGPCFM